MIEVLDDISRWQRAGRRVAVARVVGLEGSGPRDPGATMAVNETGAVAGAVSGGCVEGAAVEACLDVLAGTRDPGVVSFGYSDDDAFAVGLTCGGTVHLLIEPFDSPVFDEIRDALQGHAAIALATVTTSTDAALVPGAKLVVRPGADPLGTLGDPELDRVVARDALGGLANGVVATRHYGPHGEARRDDVAVFLESFVPSPRLVIFGAVDFTAALARVAKVLGYRVLVCDARPAFATVARFPMADDVVTEWPDRLFEKLEPPLGARDAVCVLTHDVKFDVPAIIGALHAGVGYVGAMGSRRTHARRVERLRAAGVGDDDLARVRSPIGLDLGARTPEETAVAICAEMISARSGRDARPLRDGVGPIH